MSRFSKNLIPLAAVILAGVVTAFTGLTYGKLSNRWGAPENVEAIAKRVANIPMKIGDWECVDTLKVDDEVVAMLEAESMIHRRYVNQETKEEVRMFVVIGPPGPISVHTPEVCFPSSTFTVESARKSVGLEDPERKDSFWMVDFRGTDVHAARVRAYYAWATDGPWHATSNPRWDFAGKPYLIKIQAITIQPPRENTGQADACARFFESFVPDYQRHMRQLTKSQPPFDPREG